MSKSEIEFANEQINRMSDLISREALIERLNPEYLDTRKLIEQGETHLDNLAEGYTEVYRLIKDAPTVDAEPVRYGEWLDNELSYAEDRHQAMTCSVCHKYSYRPVGEYCRWCGAKMDEVSEDDTTTD